MIPTPDPLKIMDGFLEKSRGHGYTYASEKAGMRNTFSRSTLELLAQKLFAEGQRAGLALGLDHYSAEQLYAELELRQIRPKGERLLLNAYGRECYDAGRASAIRSAPPREEETP